MILMIRDETGAMIPKKVDDLASEPALLSACQKRLFSAETSGLGKGPDAERKLSMEQLLDLAGAGNKAVQEAFSETGS